jgi:hypothetical protein
MQSQCSLVRPCLEYYYCLYGQCLHEDLYPMDGNKAVGCLLIVLLAALAAVSGQGGSIPMPLLASYLHYSPRTSKLIVFTLILAAQSSGLIFRLAVNPRLFRLRLACLVTPGLLAAAFGSVVLVSSLPNGVWDAIFLLVSVSQLPNIFRSVLHAYHYH